MRRCYGVIDSLEIGLMFAARRPRHEAAMKTANSWIISQGLLLVSGMIVIFFAFEGGLTVCFIYFHSMH